MANTSKFAKTFARQFYYFHDYSSLLYIFRNHTTFKTWDLFIHFMIFCRESLSCVTIQHLTHFPMAQTSILKLKRTFNYHSIMKWVSMSCEKVPESLSYQKKDGRAGPRPSFFWYDTDFSKQQKKINFFPKKILLLFFWYDTDSGH